MSDAFDADPVLRVEAPGWFRDALAVPFVQRSVEVGGCEINYLSWGEGDSPSDTNTSTGTSTDTSTGTEPGGEAEGGLVFVHGGGAHAHWWTHVAATFSPWTPCVALDLSGHGDSGRRAHYSLETWTDEVVAVAADAGLHRPVVVGHSMGGFVTIATAARHPEAVSGAVIIDSPVFEADAEVSAAQARESFATPRTYPDLDQVLARFRTVPPQARYLDYVLDHVARRSLRQVDGGWQWKFDADFWTAMGGSPRSSALPYLGRLDCRLALFRCEQGLVDLDIGRFMYDAMGRRVSVVELPGAGHHPMLDEPLILITALRTLLAAWLHSQPRR